MYCSANLVHCTKRVPIYINNIFRLLCCKNVINRINNCIYNIYCTICTTCTNNNNNNSITLYKVFIFSRIYTHKNAVQCGTVVQLVTLMPFLVNFLVVHTTLIVPIKVVL
jgi:hypothetical protein